MLLLKRAARGSLGNHCRVMTMIVLRASLLPFRIGMVAGVIGLVGCSLPPQGRTPYAPSPAMLSVLSEWAKMRAAPPGALAPDEARTVPSLQDAARAMSNTRGLPAQATPVATVQELVATGAGGPLQARLYLPTIAPEVPKNLPTIIYFVGGTWVTGSLDSYDESARQLMARTGWPVVSIRTRSAPEAKFPDAHDDAVAAYQWARQSLRNWGGDPNRVVLAGEGPGANLALDTALWARDHHLTVPAHLLLITPLVTTSLSGTSMSESGRSRPLTRKTVNWAQDLYTPHDRDLRDLRLNSLGRADLSPLPPSTIVLAEIDPLRSEGEALAAALTSAGVATQSRMFSGTTHDFFGLGLQVPEAGDAEQYAADQMKISLRRTVAEQVSGYRPPGHSRSARGRGWAHGPGHHRP